VLPSCQVAKVLPMNEGKEERGEAVKVVLLILNTYNKGVTYEIQLLKTLQNGRKLAVTEFQIRT
jgi:hypothetical protein